MNLWWTVWSLEESCWHPLIWITYTWLDIATPPEPGLAFVKLIKPGCTDHTRSSPALAYLLSWISKFCFCETALSKNMAKASKKRNFTENVFYVNICASVIYSCDQSWIFSIITRLQYHMILQKSFYDDLMIRKHLWLLSVLKHLLHIFREIVI